jgi:hypothetical protein
MTNSRERLAIAAVLILIASSALAETTSGGASSFNDLSPGNQKIARALFLAERPTPDGPRPLSLNQIAARKSDEGWGRVFKEMKAEGLVHEKNLGQVVSGYEHHLHTASATSHGGRTIVTTGSGRSVAGDSGHGSAETGKGGESGSEGTEQGNASAGHSHGANSVTVSTAGGATNAGGVSAGGASAHGGGAGHAR